MGPTPGLGLACCAWLRERETAAVACDNYIVEVVPSRQPPAVYPLHMVAIRDMGMTLGEIVDDIGVGAAQKRGKRGGGGEPSQVTGRCGRTDRASVDS